MERMEALKNYYTTYDEDTRLSSGHGMVEFLTTIRYIEKYRERKRYADRKKSDHCNQTDQHASCLILYFSLFILAPSDFIFRILISRPFRMILSTLPYSQEGFAVTQREGIKAIRIQFTSLIGITIPFLRFPFLLFHRLSSLYPHRSARNFPLFFHILC